MTTDRTADIPLLIYVVLVAAAAVQDVIQLRISNLLSISVALVCATALILDPGNPWWEPILAFVIALCFGIILFSFGWMGGGDAKLMAGAAFAFDMSGLLRFLPIVLMAGGVVAVVMIFFRR